MSHEKRLNKELNVFNNDPPDGITAGPNGDDIQSWSASITGPSGSPYAGGTFFLTVDFPSNYPAKPPVIKFETPIYHPNISSDDGSVFVDILGEMWRPALTITTLLVSIQSLLDDPNPEDPCEIQIGIQYVDEREKFDKTAEDWTERYAMG